MSRAKHAMFAEEYYDITEEETQEIVARYQAGDEEAAKELMKMFSNYLAKYFNLLYYNRYGFDDYDLRQFIGLFIKDNAARGALLRNKLRGDNLRKVRKAMTGINYMILRYNEERDVWNTIHMTFLYTCDHYTPQYNDRGLIPFSGYLYNYFYYMMKKNVETMLIDQLGRKTFPLFDESTDEEESGGHVGFSAPVPDFDEEAMFLSADMIDERWIAGDTAYPPFDRLTVQERQLLKWRYIDGDYTADIVARTTETPNTVRTAFATIRTKLRRALEETI